MGNSSAKRAADERYTQPTGLYPSCEWDEKVVKKLILKKKLAPRFVGSEVSSVDTEECPICMLVSLSSRSIYMQELSWWSQPINLLQEVIMHWCVGQCISDQTECFLQFKRPNSVKSILLNCSGCF